MNDTKKPLPPFTSRYSPEVPEILYNLQCTIALSTYQAGKVVLLSAPTPDKIILLARTFEGAMGIATQGNKMAIACKSNLHILANTPSMAKTYPPKPNVYDALYMPRATFHTGQLSLHDLNWNNNDLLAVNTLFSSIVKINDNYSFEPVWKPKFISQLAPEDRCHLNGTATEDKKIKYVSALGKTDTPGGWRENKLTGGIIIDVESNEIISENLAMPHSPRIYNGDLYALQSAAGELIEIDKKTGKFETVTKFDYFLRGMDKIGDYLFIGHSKLRHTTSAFKDLPIAKKSQKAGVIIVHLPSGAIVGNIMYENSVDEIYDVKILPNTVRPNIINQDHQSVSIAITTPDESYWAIPDKK
ncbi:MAG: TIGR03032 family protein [Bacteroidales bacterium]|nr:TIGR03032 family protein [Bacteroidales bacterium]